MASEMARLVLAACTKPSATHNKKNNQIHASGTCTSAHTHTACMVDAAYSPHCDHLNTQTQDTHNEKNSQTDANNTSILISVQTCSMSGAFIEKEDLEGGCEASTDKSEYQDDQIEQGRASNYSEDCNMHSRGQHDECEGEKLSEGNCNNMQDKGALVRSDAHEFGHQAQETTGHSNSHPGRLVYSDADNFGLGKSTNDEKSECNHAEKSGEHDKKRDEERVVVHSDRDKSEACNADEAFACGNEEASAERHNERKLRREGEETMEELDNDGKLVHQNEVKYRECYRNSHDKSACQDGDKFGECDNNEGKLVCNEEETSVECRHGSQDKSVYNSGGAFGKGDNNEGKLVYNVVGTAQVLCIEKLAQVYGLCVERDKSGHGQEAVLEEVCMHVCVYYCMIHVYIYINICIYICIYVYIYYIA
jgi:hypothetical protein